VFNEYTNFTGPSKGTFGSANPATQNNIIQAFTAGPFTFTANGNQTMSFTIDNGLSINGKTGNGYNENLYLPIKTGETYILGGSYPAGDSINIGVANSIDNYYDNGFNDPLWTNGVFARGSNNNIYLVYQINSSSPSGPYENDFYENIGSVTTYATYSLNSNSVTITFPDATDNKQFIEPLTGSYNFTMETFNYLGEYYFLSETNQPVQMEICQPPYSAPNTITCTT